MRFRLIAIILVGIFSISRFSSAEMSSDNYQIKWDSINYGGSDTSASASYNLRDTIGNAGAGESQSTSYLLQAGYRAGIFDQILVFDVFSQDNDSVQNATVLAGNTITVSAVTGFAADDYLLLVQDTGASQISAIGKITVVGINSITVDEWKTAGVAPVIDGTNDYVYELNGTTADLGTMNNAQINTAIIGFEVTIDNDSGYSVQIFEDGDLRLGAQTIDDVSDGTVTIANEEYGGKSSDTTLVDSTFDTADTALTSDFQKVATEDGTQFFNRNFLTLKASITASTPSGTYAQTLTLITSGNF